MAMTGGMPPPPPAVPGEEGAKVPMVPPQAAPGVPPGSPPLPGMPVTDPRMLMQPQRGQQTTPQVPSGPKEPEPETVPMEQHKARISKMGRKNERLEKELNDLRTTVQKLEQSAEMHGREQLAAKLADSEKPDGFDEWGASQQMAWIASKAVELAGSNGNQHHGDPDTVARLERIERQQAQDRHFRSLSREQMAVIEDVREEYPGVDDPKKLLNLAKMEEPGLFRDAQDHGGPAHVGRAGRGMPEMPREGLPGYEEIRNFLHSLPTDDPRIDQLGPWLIKAQMDEQYPGIHGPLPAHMR